MTSATSHPNSSSPPSSFLPPELIEQILNEETLSKRDLARCCRASHHFLASSRPVLYHSVNIITIVLEDEREDTVGYSLNPSSRSLLRTIDDYPFLARYIHHLDLRTRPSVSGTHIIDFLEIEEALELALARMPCIDSLALVDQQLWRRSPVRDLVFEHGSQWVGLSVAGSILDQDGDRRNWSDLPNLRKLHIWELARDPRVDHRIPARIKILDIESDIYCQTDLSFEPESCLKILRIPASNHHLIPHLTTLSHLRHLHIHSVAETRRTQLGHPALSSLAALTHLRILSFSVSLWRSSDNARVLDIATLLTFIPTSITHLDFPRNLPIESVLHLLETKSTPSLRFIGYPRPRRDIISSSYPQGVMGRSSEQSMERFVQVCNEKSIIMELIEEH